MSLLVAIRTTDNDILRFSHYAIIVRSEILDKNTTFCHI